MMLIYSKELMPTVVLNLDKMVVMIFWRLIIVSRQKDCKFDNMLILFFGSFLSTALHTSLRIISHVTMVHASEKRVPFFSIGAHQL